jgi:hypothetical protein
MHDDILERLGRIAGVAGIALGVTLLVFRDVLKKRIFPKLTRAQATHLLRLVIVLTWSIALAGLAAWIWVQSERAGEPGSSTERGEVPTFSMRPHNDLGARTVRADSALSNDGARGTPTTEAAGTWQRETSEASAKGQERPSGVVVVQHKVIQDPMGDISLPVLTLTFKNGSSSLRVLHGLRLSVLERQAGRGDQGSGVIQPSARWLLELPHETGGTSTLPIRVTYSPDRAIQIARDGALTLDIAVTPRLDRKPSGWRATELDAGYKIDFAFLFDDGDVAFVDEL